MPSLREFVTIGICGGYGDGDFRVSCAVADLSVKEMQELRLAFVSALYCAEDMWRRAREEKSSGCESKT